MGRQKPASPAPAARRMYLAAGDGPAADLVDAGLDLVRGGLGQGRAAAGLAQVVVDDAVRLIGAVAPRADQAVEFLAQRGERLAADRRRSRGGSGSRNRSGTRGRSGPRGVSEAWDGSGGTWGYRAF